MITKTRPIFTSEPSATAHQRILSQRGEPLFIAAWHNALMIHFEVDAAALQRCVPFELDLWKGRAFVSLVAFTMLNMRPRLGGRLAALLFRPIATHHFLNIRTYVRYGDEYGIHFMAEWLTNRLAVLLGPSTFGLPYHYGHISYKHDLKNGNVSGRIADPKCRTALTFEAHLTGAAAFQPCAAGSLDEWLMERYTAFNSARRVRRFFRVWHPPWPQRPAEAVLKDKSLLTGNWPWFNDTQLIGANFSPGFDTVWMSRPQRVTS
ncbi:MAG TPA: DUF2071 domain-containing protein [Candidatus Sulfotelmatobacter sp.]|nr:DUF2071 domain-containing protein [Candidatus Sulfotelmatobacter sp.]